ncbi:hypothetical protein PILCRDRAFT_413221 [Piloderma croceum F 1598]|uniref:Uncharacterized protein n=1 Tax=Piloderma croceum (strain F 1598) TaxID=765440 RepID=A0A0C3FW49_PILCF|nr:hypothetical protein PILCRDRAFT_413221 [Piloderma croceum F 1598]
MRQGWVRRRVTRCSGRQGKLSTSTPKQSQIKTVSSARYHSLMPYQKKEFDEGHLGKAVTHQSLSPISQPHDRLWESTISS